MKNLKILATIILIGGAISLYLSQNIEIFVAALIGGVIGAAYCYLTASKVQIQVEALALEQQILTCNPKCSTEDGVRIATGVRNKTFSPNWYYPESNVIIQFQEGRTFKVIHLVNKPNLEMIKMNVGRGPQGRKVSNYQAEYRDGVNRRGSLEVSIEANIEGAALYDFVGIVG